MDHPAYRKYCHLCWLGGRCWRYATAGTFSRASNISAILGAGLLGLAAKWMGTPVNFGNDWQDVVASALVYTAIAWVAIFFGRLLIAPFRIYHEGEWHDDVFVYREPKLAFHFYARVQKNNFVYRFRFPDAPPYSLVIYKIEYDSPYPREFISVVVASHQNQIREFKSHKDFYYTKGSTRVDKDRNMCAAAFLRGDATPFSVRIYVSGFDMGSVGEPLAPKAEPPPPVYWGSGPPRPKPDKPSLAWIHWPLGLGDEDNWQGSNIASATETSSGEFVFAFNKDLDARTLVAHPIGDTPPFRVVSANAGSVTVKFDAEPSVIKIRFDSRDEQAADQA